MNPAPRGGHAQIVQQLAELLGGPARAAGLVPILSIFNIGVPDNYRVPDGGLLRDGSDRVYYTTAAMVAEVVSPGDDSWQKLDFYAAQHVDEVLIVDPSERRVHWLGLADDRYEPLDRSGLLDLGPDALASRIDWPEGSEAERGRTPSASAPEPRVRPDPPPASAG